MFVDDLVSHTIHVGMDNLLNAILRTAFEAYVVIHFYTISRFFCHYQAQLMSPWKQQCWRSDLIGGRLSLRKKCTKWEKVRMKSWETTRGGRRNGHTNLERTVRGHLHSLCVWCNQEESFFIYLLLICRRCCVCRSSGLLVKRILMHFKLQDVAQTFSENDMVINGDDSFPVYIIRGLSQQVWRDPSISGTPWPTEAAGYSFQSFCNSRWGLCYVFYSIS